ncbi:MULTISPECIES: hypothetical protein [unclassified Thermosynechococcus]|uniref:hypothetical protein n=1 Tax=unclassified Thermosynechococcus TaxID=2622553 RepID=UPI0019E9829C|nr:MULTISPECIES: hypothetical protein [unclassified Thermosynechococcus]HIK35038.1 hypothetical protein [Thermosynechococcus sp. M98_K2018_005]HIK48480.1 hypothetical protein [Thermosynechococcus sp. M55_K2018_012]
MVQPDALLRLVNGTSRISEEDYLEGAPELIVAIASSSAAYDPQAPDDHGIFRSRHFLDCGYPGQP